MALALGRSLPICIGCLLKSSEALGYLNLTREQSVLYIHNDLFSIRPRKKKTLHQLVSQTNFLSFDHVDLHPKLPKVDWLRPRNVPRDDSKSYALLGPWELGFS